MPGPEPGGKSAAFPGPGCVSPPGGSRQAANTSISATDFADITAADPKNFSGLMVQVSQVAGDINACASCRKTCQYPSPCIRPAIAFHTPHQACLTPGTWR